MIKRSKLSCVKFNFVCTKGFFLFFLLILNFSAFAQNLLEKRITIDAKNTTVRDLLKIIEKLGDVKFAYSLDNVDNTRIVISAKNETINNILKQVFSNQNISYEAMEGLIVLHKHENVTTVTGTVFDEQGNTLPNVTVRVKNSQQIQYTGAYGEFLFNLINPTATLIFSSIGFNTLEIPLKGRISINANLKSIAKTLDEVVVVGYGTQKKITVTGAISSVTREEIQQTPSASIQNSLSGKLPGFYSQQRGGRPGDDGAVFYVRGISTFNGNTQPLILVDDIEFNYADFSNIDPNEVQSISILKDAATTAPYGVKGANGVILVTTRRGQIGTPKLTFRTEFGLQVPTHIPQFLDAASTATLFNEAAKNDALITGNQTPLFSDADIAMYRDGSDPYGHPNVNWYNTLFKSTAPISKHNLDLSGGTEKVQYFISLGYEDQGGILRDFDPTGSNNYNFDRMNFRSNLDIKATKSLSLRFDLSGNNTVTNSPVIGGVSGSAETAAFYEVFSYESLSPYIYNIYNPDGSYGYPDPNRTQPSGNANNIVGRLTNGNYKRDRQNLLNLNVSAVQSLDFITPGLQAKALIAITNGNSSTKILNRVNFPSFYYNPATDVYTPRDPNIYRTDPFSINYSGGQPNRQSSIQANLNYARSFGNHNVSALVLYNQNTKLRPDFKGDIEQPDSYKPENFRGMTSRITYNYSNKYLLEFDGGYNGTDKFAAAKRYGFFPAGAAGWVASEENFIKEHVPFINLLKFRGSYGIVGSDNLGSFANAYEENFIPGGKYSFGETDNTYTSIVPGTLGNNNVSWEKERKLDLGIDFAFFKGKLSGTVDVFDNRRYDILAQRNTIASYYGLPDGLLPPENLGIVTNKGYEAELTYQVKAGKDLGLSFKANYSFAKNKIIEMDEVTQRYPWKMQTGNAIGLVPQWIWDGYYTEAEAMNPRVPKYTGSTTVAGGPGTTLPGFLKYRDMNGDGVINDDDKGYFGKPNLPNTVIGFSTGINYKRFSLNILLQSALNSEVQIGYTQSTPFKGNLQAIHQQRWTPETAGSAEFPALITDFQGSYMSSGQYSTFWNISGNYLRLKSVELSYRLPDDWMKKMRLKGVRVYANGYNLHTWSATYNRFGLDPEVARGGSGNSFKGVYPQSAIVNLGLSVSIN